VALTSATKHKVGLLRMQQAGVILSDNAIANAYYPGKGAGLSLSTAACALPRLAQEFNLRNNTSKPKDQNQRCDRLAR
jgi:hypothetical protein